MGSFTLYHDAHGVLACIFGPYAAHSYLQSYNTVLGAWISKQCGVASGAVNKSHTGSRC